MQYDLRDLVIKTGIQEGKLRKEIQVMEALQEIFIFLGNNNQQVALFGGTAINKIYFGDRQRLSYDIDVESFSLERTRMLLMNICEKAINFRKTHRFVYKEIVIDLVKAHSIEKPILCKANSLFSFFNYPVLSVTVPSYSLEYLLAEKTIAMLSRTVNKDIYDTWVGLQLVKDKKKYMRYVRRLAGIEKLDMDYLIAALSSYVKSGAIREKDSEQIDVISRPDIQLLAKDVALKMKMLFESNRRHE